MDGWFVQEKGIDQWVPVRLVDETDLHTGETGKTDTDVTVKLSDGTGTTVNTITISSSDWRELDGGDYWLQIGAGTNEFDSYGLFRLTVECSGCETYRAIIRVGLDATLQDVANDDNLVTQIRRTHALNGGTVADFDPSDPTKTKFRDEADSADLLTSTHTATGTDITKITPTT